MFVMSFISFVEGVSYCYRLTSYNVHRNISDSVKLSESEILIIQQKGLSLKENGKIKTPNQYNSIIANFRFSIRVVKKVFEIDYDLNLGEDHRWEMFKNTIEIRNRLTHPKNSEELDISEEEVQIIVGAYEWFYEVITRIAIEIGEYLKNIAKKMDAEFQNLISELKDDQKKQQLIKSYKELKKEKNFDDLIYSAKQEE